MRIVLAASTAVTAGLIASGALGIASAETTPPSTTTAPSSIPTTPPLRTVSVQGVATESLAQNASAASATGVYRQGMADALSDGLSKAQFLAAKGGATLGAVQSIQEDGGSISCATELEYEGEQPDFALAAGSAVRVSAPAVSRARASKPATKRRKRPVAKKAAATGCTLAAQVSLVYALS